MSLSTALTPSGRYPWADPKAHPYRAADPDRPEDGCASCGYLDAHHTIGRDITPSEDHE